MNAATITRNDDDDDDNDENYDEAGSKPRNRFASGDFSEVSAEGKSAVPISRTVWPGRNFNVAGFGVDSVWMNMSALL